MVGVGGTTSAASGYASPNDAVDYYLKSRGFNASSLRSSEVVLNSLNPKWIKKLTLSYQLELFQNSREEMLKIDEQQFLGEATCTLSELEINRLDKSNGDSDISSRFDESLETFPRRILNIVMNNILTKIKLVGMDKIDNRTKTLAEATSDYGRKEFIKSHILIMGIEKYFYITHVIDGSLAAQCEVKGVLHMVVNGHLRVGERMRSSGKWLSEFLDLKESLHKCYFEGHREKGYAPELFDTLSIWILIIGV
ncbi:hypothetical protein HID58_075443 [Brassica napus]|uniref:C2 domain-containing protein n=1 Tax=Brassica napus TaxID=3708 RepID=A0ABQ7YMN4_BRANA|nr:hypothetical protein HID58_075443 [Brassica napus]